MKRFWFETVLLSQGWADRVAIEVAEGRIVAVTPDAEHSAGDERHAIAVPGMANLHSHAFQRGMAGLAERRGPSEDSFWTWRDLMYRFANRIGPDELEAIAALAFAEMLEAGFVRVGEFHYVHHDADGAPFADPAEMCVRIAAAAADTGIALTLLPVLYMQAGFGGAAPRPEQRRFVHTLDGYARLIEAARRLPEVTVGIAPHSLRAVPAEALETATALAGQGPLHLHIAEQQGEVRDCLAATGQRPVEWLFDHLAVDARWCLVHATHVTEAEVAQIAGSGAVVGLCPITEANLGDGIFPAARLLEAGGRFGIGSDSNVRIDMAEELRLLEYGQRLDHQARNLLSTPDTPSTGRTLFQQAGQGGAQALGAGPFGLAVGAPADFVTLDPRHPNLVARSGDALLDALIFTGSAGMIDGVWRAGRQWVRSGRHVARDAIAARYGRALARLLDGGPDRR